MPHAQACSLPGPLVVDSPAMTALLLDPEARRVLLPFFGSGATVSEATRFLGEPANRVLKQVYRLERHGLLRVLEEVKRGGRPIRRYGVTHREFFVPFRSTSATTLEDLLMKAVDEPNRVVAQALPHLVSQPGEVGYLVSLDQEGRLGHNLSLNGQEPLRADHLPLPWGRGAQVLWLSEALARGFLREQGDLLEKYAALAGGTPPGERYLAYFAFAPIMAEPCLLAPAEDSPS